jgi:hypothetical protein
MDFGTCLGILGAFGTAFGIWQWLENKRRGDVMIGFLHGLKTGPLNADQIKQIDDVLERLQPPKKVKKDDVGKPKTENKRT